MIRRTPEGTSAPAILLTGWVVSLAAGSPLVLAAAWVAVAALGARRLAPAAVPA